MLFLKHTSPNGKERHYDSFLAGLLGGYTVFGRTIHNSVSQQIVIYVFARVCLALAKLAVQQRQASSGPLGTGAGGGFELFGNGELRRALVRNGWPAFASISWAMVMYIFRWHPESVQSSLRNSMSYMWVLPFPSRIRAWSWRYVLTWMAVMYSRTTGIHYEHWSGITNKPVRNIPIEHRTSFSKPWAFFLYEISGLVAESKRTLNASSRDIQVALKNSNQPHVTCPLTLRELYESTKAVRDEGR
jgi:hypothetical protein